MHPVEQVLGFRVNQMRGQVETLDKQGKVTAVRPATEHESALWSEVMENYAARQSAIEASADLKSVVASNEAYREQLKKLRELAERFWIHPQPPGFERDTLELFIEIFASHNAQKHRLRQKALEIWQIEPGVDIFDFMFRQLQHLNGEMAVETEQRRQETIKERVAELAEVEARMDEMHKRAAGEQVQK